MSTEKRRCACLGTIDTEPDLQSVAHALRVHYATDEHQEFVTAIEKTDDQRSIDVPIRNGWAGVTAGLRRLS